MTKYMCNLSTHEDLVRVYDRQWQATSAVLSGGHTAQSGCTRQINDHQLQERPARFVLFD